MLGFGNYIPTEGWQTWLQTWLQQQGIAPVAAPVAAPAPAATVAAAPAPVAAATPAAAPAAPAATPTTSVPLTSTEALEAALKPYLSGGWYQWNAPQAPFDKTQFDPKFSLSLMQAYNDKYGLGLTTEQVASGIKAFGERHQNNFGTGLTSWSNPIAVAGESIALALDQSGKDSGTFWNQAVAPYLDKGQQMADENFQYTSTLMSNAYEKAHANDGPSGFGGFLTKALPIAMSAVGGPVMGAILGGSKAAGTGGDFSDILTGGLLGGGAGIVLGGGLDSIANGTALGNLITGAGSSAADTVTSGMMSGLGDTTADIVAGNALSGAAAGTGVAAGSGGGNMFDDIYSWLSDSFGGATDVASSGSEFASQDIVDLFNNAGTEGFNQYGVSLDDLATQLFDQAGTAGFDQYGAEATGLEWLKSQLPSGTSSDTLAKLGKVLFGSGGTAAGGGLLGGGTGQGSLLGALLGGLAGSYGGAKQDGTINTTQTPWGPQQPYLLDAWEKAKQASNNPINTQAQSNYQSVLQGPTTNPYLGQDNPYLQKQIDNTNDDVTRAMMPAMNQANKASGSFGNSGVADIYSKNMTDAYSRNANDMRFKDYYAQMQLQKDAVNNTLGFTQGSSAFNAAPAQDYAKTVQGNYGGTKSEPYFTNPANSILGGATLGYNLFGSK